MVDGSGAPVPLAATRDAAGTSSTFIENQLIVQAADRDTFIATYGGVVVGDNAVPPPPPEIGGGPGLPATRYVIELDPSSFTLTTFAADAASNGICGAVTFSSNKAVHLLAIAAHEDAAGRSVAINYVASPNG